MVIQMKCRQSDKFTFYVYFYDLHYAQFNVSFVFLCSLNVICKKNEVVLLVVQSVFPCPKVDTAWTFD